MSKVISGNMALRQSIYIEALSYYKLHADEFIEDVMGIPLNLYQKILVRAFFKYSFNI